MKHAELAAMELERFGLCVQGALVTMPGTVSEMLQVMDEMGVTAFAEATSKYSGDLLPLPLSLSVEERKWTEWALSAVASSDKPWRDVRAAGRKAWLWVVTFAINFLNCGAVSSVKRPAQLYPVGLPRPCQLAALSELEAAVDFFLCPSSQKNDWSPERPLSEDGNIVRLPAEDWSKYLSTRHLSYTGEVLSKVETLTWAQVEPALPPLGMGGRVSALELATGRMKELLLKPELSVLPVAEWPDRLPRAQIRAEPQEWAKITAGLVARNICSVIPAEEVLWHRGQVVGSGAFGVGKKKWLPAGDGQPKREILRLIANLVPSNSIQRCISGDITSLPYFSKWGLLELEADEQLCWSGEDVQCCFFVFGLPRPWWRYFVFMKPISRGAFVAEMVHFNAGHLADTLPSGPEIWVCMSTIPMGWISAVGVCQYLHRKIMSLPRPFGGGLDGKLEMRKDRSAPLFPDYKLREFFQCYIDNYDQAEVVSAEKPAANEELVKGLLDAAERWGVPYSADKRVSNSLEGVTLGAQIFGRAGFVIPSNDRALTIVSLTWHLLKKEFPSVKDLGILGGMWVFMMQFRRPTMSAFDNLWQAVSRRLPSQLRAQRLAIELLVAIGLVPLMRIDLRVPVDSSVAATDASEKGGGVTISTDLSALGWIRLGEGERHRQQGTNDGLMLVESFGGIGGARRALELLGVTPSVHVCIEKEEGARRVSAGAFPGVRHFSDIRLVCAKDLADCAGTEMHIKDIIHWGGFPCQGLSRLNANKNGMSDPRTQLVHEMNRIDAELAKAFPEAALHSAAENVASMSEEEKDQITAIRYCCPPVMCCPGPLSWCRRNRLYWLTWPIELTPDAELQVEKNSAKLSFSCARMPAQRWLPKGYLLVKSNAQFCTFVRAHRRKNPGHKPAGLGSCSASAVMGWEDDNSFHYGVVAYLTGQLLHQRGYLKRGPTAGDLADLATVPQGLAWPTRSE